MPNLNLFVCPGDLTGQVLACMSLLPIAILVGFVTLIVFKRELHTVGHMMSQTSRVLGQIPNNIPTCSPFLYLCVCSFSLSQISFFGGLIMNEGLNWLLKHILREPRPCGGKKRQCVCLFKHTEPHQFNKHMII